MKCRGNLGEELAIMRLLRGVYPERCGILRYTQNDIALKGLEYGIR